MAQLILMERGAEQMYVPSEKLKQFLQDGWKEIGRNDLPAEATNKKAGGDKPARTNKKAGGDKPARTNKKAGKASESDAESPDEPTDAEDEED